MAYCGVLDRMSVLLLQQVQVREEPLLEVREGELRRADHHGEHLRDPDPVRYVRLYQCGGNSLSEIAFILV